MLERLTTLLAGMGTPAQLQAVYEAVTVLSENGFHQCEQIVQDEVALCSNEPAKLITNLTDLRLIPLFREFLQEMGIALVDGLPLASVTEIFEATIRIENFEDKDLTYNLATSDEDSVEIYLGLLAVVSTKSEEHFAPMVESVSDYLIKRIAEVIGDFDEQPGVDPLVHARAKARVLRFIEVLNHDAPSVLDEYVKLDELRLGCTIEPLLEPLEEEHDKLAKNVVVAMIVLYVLSSDVEDGEVAKNVHRIIADFYIDLNDAFTANKFAVGYLSRMGYE